jgi:excisionase family DNA binding protein
MDTKDALTISVQRAGELLGLSRNAAYAAAKNGQLPVLKIGKRLLVPKVRFDRLLSEAGNEPKPTS